MKDEMRTNPSGDLISRADAIGAIASADPKDREYHYYKHIAIGVLSALPSVEVVQDGRNNIKRYPNCQMRTSLGNCDAIGGFCTSINAPICDAFHKLVEAVQGEWIECLAYNPDLDADVLYIECDQCGHRPYFSGSYRPKYCEECGARMTKGGDSE